MKGIYTSGDEYTPDGINIPGMKNITPQYIKPPDMPGRLKRAEAIREVTKFPDARFQIKPSATLGKIG
jgi:hypothetical protein